MRATAFLFFFKYCNIAIIAVVTVQANNSTVNKMRKGRFSRGHVQFCKRFVYMFIQHKQQKLCLISRNYTESEKKTYFVFLSVGLILRTYYFSK